LASLYELARAWEGRRLSLAANLGHGVFGMLYIGWLFSFGVLLRVDYAPATLWGWQVERGALWVLWLLAMLWLGDSGAYFVGRAIGRRKLAPTLSPAKTVEGALANLALCLLVGWQGGAALGLPLGWAIVGGLGVGVLGQLGDLFESALKRAVGVKDFGGILPGHGGVLDQVRQLPLQRAVGLVDRAERRLSLVNRGQFGAKPAGIAIPASKPACRGNADARRNEASSLGMARNGVAATPAVAGATTDRLPLLTPTTSHIPA
jgi:hypothetical protein